MPRLIWSPAALRDVQRLYRFLADKNPAAATRAVRVIREGVKIIADHPASGTDRGHGSRLPRVDHRLRRQGYVVLYRLDGDTAVNLAVRHQREAGY